MTSSAPVKRRERIFYLDFVRAFATVVIVLTHFNNPYLAGGGYLLTNQPFGIYVGGLGVSLFLIISGAALTYTYGSRPSMDLKRFYWKRFVGIYPMFWIAWIVAVLYYFVDTRGYPPINVPKTHLIFTVFGVDGYLANFHVQTAYLLGEWFLGFILIYYIVFPLLLAGVKRFPKVTAAIILVLYVMTLVAVHGHPAFPSAILLTTRLPELAFGMYIMTYAKRISAWCVLPALIVLAVAAQFPTEIPEDLATTFVGIAFYTILVVMVRWIAIGPVRTLTKLISVYSYPIFLVHHVVIMQLYAKIDTTNFFMAQRVVMFLVVCALTLALAVALDRLTKQVMALFRAGFSGSWWRVEVASSER